MKKITIKIGLYSMAITAFLLGSCKKFLDEKPNAQLQTATSVSIIQGLLDDNNDMNRIGANDAEIVADNYYINY